METDKITQLRAKKLGAMIRTSRTTLDKSIEECAQALGVPVETFDSYELGTQSPSLPELELLSYYLDIPIDRFWGETTYLKPTTANRPLDADRVLRLRQRMIGVQLRKFRLEAGLTQEQVRAELGLDEAELNSIEVGQSAVPIPVLEKAAGLLNRSIRDFYDQKGPVGNWSTRRRVVEDFLALPPELQEFVCKPINRPFIELAQRLSQMEVNKLRSVAEGLLEITL